MHTDLTAALRALAPDAEFYLYGCNSALIAALRALDADPSYDPDCSVRAALRLAASKTEEALRASA